MAKSLATFRRPSQNGRGPISVVLVVCATLFFGVLNSSGVTVILPEMGTTFSVNPGLLSWVMSGYLLAFGIAIPFYGRLADKFGARPLFLLGISLFSIGSVACFMAPNFVGMLSARILQAVGGAAFPGLGMVIASRAFPVEKRGFVLGAISATIGLGSALGPLLAGIISDLVHWRVIFGMSALVILVFPFAWRTLSKSEAHATGSMDVLGGMFMALGVTGLLFAVSQSSQAGWLDTKVILALFFSFIGFMGLVFRQQTSTTPFIPRELLGNTRYLRLISVAFLAAGVNLAALIGFPLMLATQNGLGTFQIGLVMLPGAIATAVCGVLAGRMVDLLGPRLPTWLGSAMMLTSMVLLSFLAGESLVIVAILAGLLGGGFAFLNTPIAAIVSIMVKPATLASALSMNTMMFFVGGSLGSALFSSILTASTEAPSPWNPLYPGPSIGYSNAFSALAIFVLLVLALVAPLPTKKMVDAEKVIEADQPSWTPDCAVPWCAELEMKDHNNQ